MHINKLPIEILSHILQYAAAGNEREGVSFCFGFSEATYTGNSEPLLKRYVRGPVPPDLLKWDATANIRSVCVAWHDWGLKYALQDIYIRKWRGGQRWADLPLRRESFLVYENVDPTGISVYKDPFSSLRRSQEILTTYADIAQKVRRIWLGGFHTYHSDKAIVQTLAACTNLTFLSISWMTLRRLSPSNWAQLLGDSKRRSLKSLELLAVELSEKDTMHLKNVVDESPLTSSLVNFENLERLKIFGDTKILPVTDDDLLNISRSARNLREFHASGISTITIRGVVAILKSSRNSLRVLEHSPRSDDGFRHPHPGLLSKNDNICRILSDCPYLESVSLSVPSVCGELFDRDAVRWKGDFQIRAARICSRGRNNRENSPQCSLENLLNKARTLIANKEKSRIPQMLVMEIFFGDFIFEPHLRRVHGDFELARVTSDRGWPSTSEPSRKGPFGSTGLYGKDAEVIFEQVHENDFLFAFQRGFVDIYS